MKRFVALVLVISALIGLCGCSVLSQQRLTRLPVSILPSDGDEPPINITWAPLSQGQKEEGVRIVGTYNYYGDENKFILEKCVDEDAVQVTVISYMDGKLYEQAIYEAEYIDIDRDMIITAGVVEYQEDFENWTPEYVDREHVNTNTSVGFVLNCCDEQGNPQRMSFIEDADTYNMIQYEEISALSSGWKSSEKKIIEEMAQEAFAEWLYAIVMIANGDF